MRGIFERLETTPGQERVIMEVVDDVRAAAGQVRDVAQDARRDIADVVRGEHFDQEKVRELFAKHDAKIEDVKKAVMAGIGKIHESLEPRQRAELASLLESFGRYSRYGGPWRRGGFGHHGMHGHWSET